MSRAVLTFFVLTAVVLNGQTNLGTGSIFVDCAGKTNLVWSNVPPRLILQRTSDFVTWSNKMHVTWDDPPTNSLYFSVPLKRSEDRQFFRLVSY